MKKSVEELKKQLDKINNPLSVGEYATKRGLSEWYVRKLCRIGKVECLKLGQVWIIDAKG